MNTQVIYKRPESIIVIVYTTCAKVLLLQRRDDTHFWQSITGSLLQNEVHPIDAALRELREETGLDNLSGELRDCHHHAWFDIYPHWQHRYEPGVKRNLEHVFSFKLKEPRTITLSDEHLDYCWLTKEKAIEKVISTTNRDAILHFVEVSKENGGT